METALWISSGLFRGSTSVVKFFVPRILYDPRVFVYASARIVGYFIPTRIVELSGRCVKYIEILSSFVSIMDQVQQLEQQIETLKKLCIDNEEKYTKAKLVNASLSSRILFLAEQIDELERRNGEQYKQEQIKSREVIENLKTQHNLHLKEAETRIISCEEENLKLKEELARHKIVINKMEIDRRKLMKEMEDLTEEVISARNEANASKEQEKRVSEESESKTQLIEQLLSELEKLKTGNTLQIEELYKELCMLKEKNFLLEESNDDLQTSLLLAGLEQGQLLTGNCNRLSVDLECMSNEEIQKALKEEQNFNAQLKVYIDGILLRILEKYPELLEIKQMSNTI